MRLEPLAMDHVADLVAAAGDDRATFGWTRVPWDEESAEAYVAEALERRDRGDQLPFATRSLALGRVVGTTRFYDLAPWDWTGLFPGSAALAGDDVPPRASIGHTWLGPAAQRTPVNTEAKVLMLDHAFATWGVAAVRIQSDARNVRSRTAIERIGFSLDGILRVDMPAPDGTLRDSAVYSMLAAEWPAHRARLVAALAT